jgi:hypothetical protein
MSYASQKGLVPTLSQVTTLQNQISLLGSSNTYSSNATINLVNNTSQLIQTFTIPTNGVYLLAFQFSLVLDNSVPFTFESLKVNIPDTPENYFTSLLVNTSVTTGGVIAFTTLIPYSTYKLGNVVTLDVYPIFTGATNNSITNILTTTYQIGI